MDHFCLHHKEFSRILFENPVLRLNTNYRRLPNCRITIPIRHCHLFFNKVYRGLYHNGFSRILFENPVFETVQRTNQTFSFFITQHVTGGVIKVFYNFNRGFSCLRILFLRLNTNYRRLPNCRIPIRHFHFFITQHVTGGCH